MPEMNEEDAARLDGLVSRLDQAIWQLEMNEHFRAMERFRPPVDAAKPELWEKLLGGYGNDCE